MPPEKAKSIAPRWKRALHFPKEFWQRDSSESHIGDGCHRDMSYVGQFFSALRQEGIRSESSRHGPGPFP
ncbi:MAG: hypothetical protein CMN02_10670 [Roseibacillus sp.]|nr:hypothetical protein [Roseibacillus sp.]